MLPRRRPAVLPPAVRRGTFDEVVQGYTRDEAVAEAQRCLLCKNARCQTACPLQNQIPRWMAELQQGHVEEAYRLIRHTSPMPGLCSRLCPQERLCEGACALGIKHESVAIGWLERFLCDQAESSWDAPPPEPSRPAAGARRVAVIGSGPAGLAAAQRLALEGHHVTVFERAGKPGGVLRWIPRFKLPAAVLETHLAMLRALGVEFVVNREIGGVEPLLTQEGFDAVFLGIGAGRPAMPELPGRSLGGILSSTEFLVRVFGDPDALPAGWPPITSLAGRHVVVLGGGDSAMDCLRTAVRLGAASATCVYRRDEENMPGSKKEVQAAKEERVTFQFLAAPTAFRTRDGKAVSRVECVRMALGPPDASGRRRPSPVPGSAFLVEANLVVLAFGYEVEPTFGAITVNPATGATPVRGLFAGGDCVTGPDLVSTAARAGVVAAAGIQRYFAGE
ncbi:MAG: hypothetical protein A3C53_08505, partial [Omnitrophica WOR_2 bacterium RIFCSPHIGHO2_02_FULL_68_15]